MAVLPSKTERVVVHTGGSPDGEEVMKGVAAVLLMVLVLAASGCAYKYSYTTGLPAGGQRIEKWQNISGWGWNEPAPVDLDEMSPAGVAEFGSYMSFPNWLCTFFTLGFYSPQTVYVIPSRPPLRTGEGER